MAKNIRLGIQLPSNNQLKAEIQSAIKVMEKHATLDFKIDTKEFTKSLSSMSNELNKLKTQLSKFNVLENISSDTVSIAKTKKEVNDLAEAMGKLNEKSQLRVKADEQKEQLKQTQAINKAMEERYALEQNYDNLWQKLLKNRELQEQASYQKSLNNINKLKEQLQGKLNIASNNNLIDVSVINKLKSQLDSITTNTSEKEVNELKNAISNLASSDSQITRLQNAITKYGISIDNLKEKYRGLLPESELNEAILKIEKLKDTLSSIQKGDNFTNINISNMLNEASNSMAKLGNATRNSNAEVVTFGNAFKDIASKVGVFNIVDDAINKIKAGFSEGVQAVIDMDTELSNLQKVIDGLSDKQLIQMRDSAVEIGTALGRSSTEIMASFSEFGRQFKDTDIVRQLSELSVMASNTMENISAEQVAKSLTTILKSMELGVDDAKSILDGLNEIQNNFRVNSGELLSGIAEVGSVAKTSGVELDKLSGYISSIVISTGGSGSEVGNALQTLFSRIYGVGKKTLEEIGVAVEDVNGEFRSATDILDDYYKKWQTMSDTEKITSAQNLAGVQRYNQLVALMNNYDTAIQAAETSLNSLDSVQKENEIYLNSIEGRMASLKAATEGFWYNLISSDMIKGGVSVLQTLIQALDGLQNTFGSLGLSVGTLSSAFLMFTNNPLKQLSKDIVNHEVTAGGLLDTYNQIKTKIAETGNTMTVAQKSSLALKTGYDLLGNSAFIAQVKVALLQAALSMGLSLAITAVIGGITKLVSSLNTSGKSMDDVKSQADALANSLDNVEQERDLVGQYAELKTQLQDANLEESKRNELKSQLEQVMQDLIASEQGYYGILNNENLTLDEQLQKMEQIRQSRLFDEAKELDDDMMSQKDIEKKVKLLEGYIQTYNDIQNAIKSGDERKLIDLIGVSDVNEANQMLKDTKNKINELDGEILKYNSSVMLMKDANYETSRSTISLKKDTSDFISSLNESTNAIDENTRAKEENANMEMSGGTSGNSEDVSKLTTAYSEALTKLQNIYDLYDSLNEETSMTPNLVSQVAEMFPQIGSKITDIVAVQEYLNGKIEEQKGIAEDAYLAMIQSDKEYYAQKLQEDENWLNSFIDVINRGNNAQEEGYNLDLSNFKDYILDKASMNDTTIDALAVWLQNLIGGNKDAYKTDLANTRNWAQTKALILQKLDEQITKVESRMANHLTNIKNSSGINDADSLIDEKLYIRANEELKKLETAKANIETDFSNIGAGFSDWANNLKKTGSSLAGSGVGSSSNSNKKGSSSSSKEVADLEDLTDRYHDLEDAITDYSNALSFNKLLQNNADDKEKINLMKQEIGLYKKQADAVKKLNTEQKKEANELKSSLSKQGVKFDSSGDISNYNAILKSKTKWANSFSGDKKELAIEQVKNLESALKRYDELVNNLIPKQEQEWQSLKNSISDVNNSIKELYEDQLNLVASQEKEIADMIEYYANKKTEAKKEAVQKELDLEKKRLEGLKKSLSEEKELYNKQISEENYESDLAKERQKLAEIQAEIDRLSMDNSAKGKQHSPYVQKCA